MAGPVTLFLTAAAFDARQYATVKPCGRGSGPKNDIGDVISDNDPVTA